MAITAVGSFYNTGGTGVNTLPVTTVNIGDVMMFSTSILDTVITSTGVSGGNVTGWTRIVSPIADNTASFTSDLWMGKVSTVGTATITTTWSGDVTGQALILDAQQFTAGLGAATVWAVDGVQAAGQVNASSTTVAYPPLTASGGGRLYYGYAVSSGSGSAGSTPGFSYGVDLFACVATWNVAVSGAVSPTATQSSAATSDAVAAILTATSPALSPPYPGLLVSRLRPYFG
jgi:hypothetical protein